jgi:hypothetical protein
MSLLIFWPAGAPAAFVLSASANITASGAATTALLTPPSGKTTADFQAGRIQDDENPADVIDLASGKYTEFEWSLKAIGTQVTGSDVYEFRIVANDAPLDSYGQTPQGTIASSGVSGDLTQPLGALTLVSTGTVDVAGVSAATLGVLTSTATGTVDVQGVSSPTLDALAVASTGTVDVQGVSAITLDALTASSTGTVDIAGDVTQALGALVLDSQGSVGNIPISGDLTQTLDALTLASAGTVDVAGDVTQSLGVLTLAAAGGVDVQGTASPTLDVLMLSAVGTVDIAGVVAVTLDPLTSVATGTVDIAGALAQALDAVSLVSDGIVGNPPIIGDLTQTLGILTAVSSGTVEISGQAVPTLAALTLAATATTEIQGTAAVTLGALTSAAPGTVTIAGVLGTYAALVMADGASHYWTLDDSDGFLAVDSITNDVAYRMNVQTFPAGVQFLRPGLIHERAAAHVDGQDRLATNATINPVSSALSLELWFTPDIVDVSAGPIVVWSTDNDTMLYLTATDIGAKIKTGGGGTTNTFDVPIVPVAGQLYHVVVTYDGTWFGIYINGVQGLAPATGTIAVGNRFVLGSREQVQYTGFRGVIDEVAAYPVALTDAQVRAHWAAGGTSSVLGPLTAGATGAVAITGSLTATLGALAVVPEVAWQPVMRPGQRYLAQFTSGTRTSTVLTSSSTETELTELVEA